MPLYIKNLNGEHVDSVSINFMGYGTADKQAELKAAIAGGFSNNLQGVMKALDNKISKASTGKLFYYLSKNYTVSFDYGTNPSRRY